MSGRDDVSTPLGQRFFIGLSSIIQINATPGQNVLVIKGITFSTLEIGGVTLTWGIGYPFTAGEALSFNSDGTIYLAATGMTAQIALFRGRSDGFNQT